MNVRFVIYDFFCANDNSLVSVSAMLRSEIIHGCYSLEISLASRFSLGPIYKSMLRLSGFRLRQAYFELTKVEGETWVL